MKIHIYHIQRINVQSKGVINKGTNFNKNTNNETLTSNLHNYRSKYFYYIIILLRLLFYLQLPHLWWRKRFQPFFSPSTSAATVTWVWSDSSEFLATVQMASKVSKPHSRLLHMSMCPREYVDMYMCAPVSSTTSRCPSLWRVE